MFYTDFEEEKVTGNIKYIPVKGVNNDIRLTLYVEVTGIQIIIDDRGEQKSHKTQWRLASKTEEEIVDIHGSLQVTT